MNPFLQHFYVSIKREANKVPMLKKQRNDKLKNLQSQLELMEDAHKMTPDKVLKIEIDKKEQN